MMLLQQSECQDLDIQLLAAHGADDRRELIRLYGLAADLAEQEVRIEAACFYLTHAYVFALELGDDRLTDLYDRLLAYGREE